jgi:hypothetical protein
VRNLPFENVTKEELVAELVSMASAVAPVVKVVVFNDSQALLQMESIGSARSLLDRYEGSSPALLRGKRIRLQYSLQQEVVSAGNHKNIYLNPNYQHAPPPSPLSSPSSLVNLGPPSMGGGSPSTLSIGPSSSSSSHLSHYPHHQTGGVSNRNNMMSQPGSGLSLSQLSASKSGGSGTGSGSSSRHRSPSLQPIDARKSPLVQPVPIGPGRHRGSTPSSHSGSPSPSPPPMHGNQQQGSYISPSTTPSPTASPAPHHHLQHGGNHHVGSHQHHNPHNVGPFAPHAFGLPLSTPSPPPSSYVSSSSGGNAVGHGPYGPFSPSSSQSLHPPSYSNSSSRASSRERSLDREHRQQQMERQERHLEQQLHEQQQQQQQQQQRGEGQQREHRRQQQPIGTSIPSSPGSTAVSPSLSPSSPHSLSPSSSAAPSPLLQPSSASSSSVYSGPTLLHPSAIQPSAAIAIAAIGGGGNNNTSTTGSRVMTAHSSRSASPAATLNPQQGSSVLPVGGGGGSSVFGDSGFFPPGGPVPVKPRGATSSLLHQSHPSSAHASGHSTPTSNQSSSGPFALHAAFQSSLPNLAPIHRPPSMNQMHPGSGGGQMESRGHPNAHDRHAAAAAAAHMYPPPFDGHHPERSHTPGGGGRPNDSVADLKRQLDEAHRQIQSLEKDLSSNVRHPSWDAHEPRSAGGSSGRGRLDSDGSISGDHTGRAKWDRVKWDMQMLVANSAGDVENSHVARLTDQSLKELSDTLDRTKQVIARELDRRRQCKICNNHEASVVFLPCKHMVVCENCQSMVSQCPMQLCRQDIQDMFIPSLV